LVAGDDDPFRREQELAVVLLPFESARDHKRVRTPQVRVEVDQPRVVGHGGQNLGEPVEHARRRRVDVVPQRGNVREACGLVHHFFGYHGVLQEEGAGPAGLAELAEGVRVDHVPLSEAAHSTARLRSSIRNGLRLFKQIERQNSPGEMLPPSRACSMRTVSSRPLYLRTAFSGWMGLRGPPLGSLLNSLRNSSRWLVAVSRLMIPRLSALTVTALAVTLNSSTAAFMSASDV